MRKSVVNTYACGLLTALLPLSSCSEDEYVINSVWQSTALVTVRPVEGGAFVLQLDENTTLHPTNLPVSPYGDKEVRALVNYTDETRCGNSRKVHVNWMDSIRTKLPVASQKEENDSVYGNDPIEIVKDWVTIAEDGFLTLRLRTVWGMPGSTHVVNLLTGVNPDNPYELELRHDAQGDTYGSMGDALVAFNLNGLMRQDSLSKVRFKLTWLSFSGKKSAEFDLRVRRSAEMPNPSDALFNIRLK